MDGDTHQVFWNTLARVYGVRGDFIASHLRGMIVVGVDDIIVVYLTYCYVPRSNLHSGEVAVCIREG
jgi:hypothetical protein